MATRRWNGRLALLGLGVLLLAACAPAAAPAATGAPAKPAAAAPVAPPAAQAAPGNVAPPSGGPQLDALVASAKPEGKLVVAVGPGDLHRNAVAAFKQRYPEINMEITGTFGSPFGTRILAEREGGQYLWDVYVGGAETQNTTLKPRGVLDPLRPALFLPEVLDDAKWVGGFGGGNALDGWIDQDAQYVFAFDATVNFHMVVNRDQVPEAELSTLDQLLDPRWKGKIVFHDPRTTGAGSGVVGHFLITKGEDWLRRFYAQDLVIVSDTRQVAEALARGSTPIGMDVTELDEFQKSGLARNIKYLDPDSPAGRRIAAGYGNLALINRAPHPNATKLFANWLLSQDGQTAWVQATERNSRRTDVASPPATAPKPGQEYLNISKEELQPQILRAIQIAKEMIR